MAFKRISSFDVDHTKLQKGMYISRIDDDIITYDIRMKLPNKDVLDNAAIHTFEHLFATYARNTKWANEIVYVGPMGCLTGFYFLTRDKLPHADAINLVKESFNFILNYNEEIPGATEIECGNYKLHDLNGAKEIAKDMLEVLKDWNQERLNYT